MEVKGVVIDDTFAEAFESYYSRILVTAKDLRWAETAGMSATGYATSIIGCTAEAGIEAVLSEKDTPDGRPGVVLQFWTGKKKMLHELLGRIGQSILTAPTTAVFNWCNDCELLDVGNKMRFFADGFDTVKEIGDRKMVSVPVMMGEFLIEKDLGFSKGVAGGNFLIMGESQNSTLEAAEKAAGAVRDSPGVISSFPGGVCASGSKVGSKRYKFMHATTNEAYCPTLREMVSDTLVPLDVNAVAEIVINGVSEDAVRGSMKAAIEAAAEIKGIGRISAANYGGDLGNVHIRLHSLWK